MNNEEVKIRFEGKVEFLNESKDYLLTVTDTSLIFKEIKDLMNKDYKIVKEIIIKDIKNINNTAMVEYENKKMTIHTRDEIFSFICVSDEEASRILNIIKDVLGLGFVKTVEKVSVAIEDGFEGVVNVAKGFAKEVSESEAVKEGAQAIKEAFTGFWDSLNNKK